MAEQIAGVPASPDDPGSIDNPVWLVEQGGRYIGPLSTLQLAIAAKSRMLNSDAQIWRDGLPRWFAASELSGFLSPPPDQPSAGAIETAPYRPPESTRNAERSAPAVPRARGATPPSLLPVAWQAPEPDHHFSRLREMLRRIRTGVVPTVMPAPAE